MHKGNIPVRLVKDGFSFEASHRLVNYKGPCEKWHGHPRWKLAGCAQPMMDSN